MKKALILYICLWLSYGCSDGSQFPQNISVASETTESILSIEDVRESRTILEKEETREEDQVLKLLYPKGAYWQYNGNIYYAPADLGYTETIWRKLSKERAHLISKDLPQRMLDRIDMVDINSFVGVSESFARDKNYLYYQNFPVAVLSNSGHSGFQIIPQEIKGKYKLYNPSENHLPFLTDLTKADTYLLTDQWKQYGIFFLNEEEVCATYVEPAGFVISGNSTRHYDSSIAITCFPKGENAVSEFLNKE